jgi:uncharacterized small protein (DUF1192 family)
MVLQWVSRLILDTILTHIEALCRKTKAVIANGHVGASILQAPHLEYSHQWSVCQIPQEFHFKSIGMGVCPTWMDNDFFKELKDNIKCWKDAKKLLGPNLALMTELEEQMLVCKAEIARWEAERWKVGIRMDQALLKNKTLSKEMEGISGKWIKKSK